IYGIQLTDCSVFGRPPIHRRKANPRAWVATPPSIRVQTQIFATTASPVKSMCGAVFVARLVIMHFFTKLLNDRRDYFLTRSLSRFFSSLMNSCTSLKSMYTDANRTYATLSSCF